MSLSQRVMAKTSTSFVMKLDKGVAIACVSCLACVVLADNASMAEMSTDPLSVVRHTFLNDGDWFYKAIIYSICSSLVLRIFRLYHNKQHSR